VRCPWCDVKVPVEDWVKHIESHKDPDYDRKLIRESRGKHVSPPHGVDDPEMISFARCVAEKLTALPQPSEYPSGPTGYISRLLEKRMELERAMYDVLLGEKTLVDFSRLVTQVWDNDKSK